MNSPMADLPPPPATLCVEGRGQPFSASPASLTASGASPPRRAANRCRHSRHAKGSSHTKTLGSATKAPAKAAGPGKQLLTQLAHGEGAQLVQLHDRGHGGEDQARVQRVAARLQAQAGERGGLNGVPSGAWLLRTECRDGGVSSSAATVRLQCPGCSREHTDALLCCPSCRTCTACTILSASSSMKMSEPMKMLAAGRKKNNNKTTWFVGGQNQPWRLGRQASGQARRWANMSAKPAAALAHAQWHNGGGAAGARRLQRLQLHSNALVERPQRTGRHVLLEVGKVLGVAQLLQQVAHQLHAHLARIKQDRK